MSEAAKEVQKELSANNVLVTLGEGGALLVPASKESTGSGYEQPVEQPHNTFQAATAVTNIVDTTAAGDCFRGAFAVALLEGRNEQYAMQFATNAASLCIQTRGAIPSIPTRQDVLFLPNPMPPQMQVMARRDSLE